MLDLALFAFGAALGLLCLIVLIYTYYGTFSALVMGGLGALFVVTGFQDGRTDLILVGSTVLLLDLAICAFMWRRRA